GRARRAVLAERAPVAAPALARCGAGGTCADGGGDGDGRDVLRVREGAGRRADRRPGAARDRARRRRGHRFLARCGACGRPARRRALRPGPCVPRAGGRVDVCGEDHLRGSSSRPGPSGNRAREPRSRALAPHRSARRAPWAWRHDLARSRGRRRHVRACRGSAGRRAAHGVRSMAARPSTVSPARAAAFDVLLRVFEGDAYADRALRSAGAALDERDRALAQRLSYGAVQRVRTLDQAIETLAPRRPARLDAPVRAALRLGAYQLAFVDGVARYAAVNESVELGRGAGLGGAGAVPTPVLRP